MSEVALTFTMTMPCVFTQSPSMTRPAALIMIFFSFHGDPVFQVTLQLCTKLACGNTVDNGVWKLKQHPEFYFGSTSAFDR